MSNCVSMPSHQHELFLLMFQNCPSLAVELLREVFGVEVPEHSQVRTGNAALTDVRPAEYRADLVVEVWRAEEPVLGIIVEVQLRSDGHKRYSWPAYLMGLRARLKCPCVLLVVTPSEATARWAATPIEVGCGTLTPLVVGPKRVPVVTDAQRAKRAPELALLSVMAHGRGKVETALRVAASAVAGSMCLDEDRRVLYLDVIEAALSEAARKAFAMLPENYEFQGPTFKRAKREGKLEGMLEGMREGKLEGMREGRLALAAGLLDVLEARGVAVNEAVRERVSASEDVEQLRAWLRRAAVVASADELFVEGE